ncbi:hypothetical protein BGZ72_000469 [Mortierella alpina]|nr:hypothetical protein BGZ72_000469 [Mortierella alpina]
MPVIRHYPAPAFRHMATQSQRSGSLDVCDTSEKFKKYYARMLRPRLLRSYSTSRRDASRSGTRGAIASVAEIKDTLRLNESAELKMYIACILKMMLNPNEYMIYEQRNLALLRSLKLGEQAFCPSPDDRALRSLLVLTMLEYAPNISSIHIPVSTLLTHKEYYERFAQVLESGLPQLTDLTLTSSKDQECVVLFQRFLRILQACCRKPLMTELTCDFSVTFSSKADTTALNQTLRCLARSNSALKKLRLPRSSKKGLSTTFLIPFLRNCVPNLETLTVPHVAERDWHKLEATLKDHCPNLDHLHIDFSDAQDSLQQDEFYAGIIPFRQGFKGITFESNTRLYKIPEALLQHHSQTLQHVEFSSKAIVSSKEIQQILCSCVSLKTFIASESPSSFLKLSDALESDWVCLGLQKLHLRLQSDRACLRRTLELGFDQDQELNPKQLKYTKGDMGAGYLAVRKLYQKVGKLTSLEELYLVQWGGFSGIHVMDWTLSEGLPYLTGLQKLSCLVMNYGYGNVARADVVLMEKHWPVLNRVKFMFLQGVMQRIIGGSEHWMWLKERRPCLDFFCKEL